MKRKWLWLLAGVPLVVGLVLARRLADKRPRLVARGLKVSEMAISPDGKRIVVQGNWSAKSRIIRLDDGSQVSIPSSSSAFFFSPDGTKLYQLNFEFEHQGESFHQTLVLYDADSGRVEGRFQFERGLNLYGALWRDGEVVAESPRQTWHFEAHGLRLSGTQKRQPARRNATLCPDGKTLYWRSEEERMSTTPMTLYFADLGSGKILWQGKLALVGGMPLGFSVDGRTVLFSDGKRKGEVIARDTRTGAEQWRLRGPQSSVLALAPDQSAVYEARGNGELWKWRR